MGAGISPKKMSGMIYRRLKRTQRQFKARGIECVYIRQELRGNKFVVYYTGTSASNAEVVRWLVLRFNPDNQPSSAKKGKGDIDFTDFPSRDIPEHSKGGFEAGINRVLQNK